MRLELFEIKIVRKIVLRPFNKKSIFFQALILAKKKWNFGNLR